jgi:hypothetical protein
MAVMDAKIAAPMKFARLDPAWRALREYLPHQVKRGNVSFRVLDRRHEPPA